MGWGVGFVGRTCLINMSSLFERWSSYQRVRNIATQNAINSRVHRGGHGFAGCHLLCDLWDRKQQGSVHWLGLKKKKSCHKSGPPWLNSQEHLQVLEAMRADSYWALRSCIADTITFVARHLVLMSSSSPHLLSGILRPILQNCRENQWAHMPSLGLSWTVSWWRSG